MSSSFTKTGLLLLGIVLTLFLPRDVAAGEEDSLSITNADWIASPGGEAPSVGMPGVHVHGAILTPVGRNMPLPIFRKSFILDNTPISRAQVAVCGLGHFELTVNGEKVGDHFLDPPWSDYADTCYYVCFDELSLAEAGRSDVVYRMIDRTDPPGYGCMLKQHGLQTLSERWDRPGSSLNHCMFGHIQEWFQQYLLGIRQASGSTGYQKVLIDPFIPDDLQWAKGSFDSPNGRIEVAWVRQGGTVEVTVKAEKAEIVVPPQRKDVQWKFR